MPIEKPSKYEGGAQLWADLANIEDLDQISEGQRLVLLERLTDLLTVLLSTNFFLGGPTPPDSPAKVRKDLQALQAKRKAATAMLSEAHDLAQQLIGGLLDSQTVDFSMFEKSGIRIGWRLTGDEGTVEQVFVPDGKTFSWPAAFLVFMLSPGDLFLFRRCPICGNVFVRNRRKMYCSHPCRDKANETARPATEERRDQVAAASRKYRASSKKEKTKKNAVGSSPRTGTRERKGGGASSSR